MFSQKWLREHFSYHPDGYLMRKRYIGGPTYEGQKVLGCLSPTSGYKSVCIQHKRLLLHRVIFCLMKGYCPEFLDHKDQNRLNNRIGNLRPATKRLNCFHRKVSNGTVSGIRGVNFKKDKGLWRGRVTIDGRSIYLGSSKNKQVIVKRVLSFQKKRMAELLKE